MLFAARTSEGQTVGEFASLSCWCPALRFSAQPTHLMPESMNSSPALPRVRFAPSPTGFLHVGSARTFIFNWLYARRNGGTMILRLDDTDMERNTDASVTSIFEGLKWLGLSWDEEYKQSERLQLHRKVAWAIFEKGLAYRDLTP